jgi:uncharacterized protein
MKRLIAKLILSLLLLLISVILLLLYAAYKDYTDYFQTQYDSLTTVAERCDAVHGKYWITLSNIHGFKVECGLLVPPDTNKKYPAIILMGGKATGKYAIDYALDIDNVIILALDYPYEPRGTYTFWTIVLDIPDVRKALIDMVPASMLALDYLVQRKDVDTSKIIILGYSFGAPFVPVISSMDRRITVAAMVYGGGDLTTMIRHNAARYENCALSEFIGRLGGLLLHPIEPMKYADKISPTPLVMINGSNDEQIPRYNTELFFNAAREPKKLIWLDSKHVNTNNPELTRRIIFVLKEELKRLNKL